MIFESTVPAAVLAVLLAVADAILAKAKTKKRRRAHA
jgi:hypothetical protein